MTHPRLQPALRLVQNPAIERLRSMQFPNENPPLSHEGYCRLVEMLVDASRPRTEIEAELGVDTKRLLDAIIELARFTLATRGTPRVKVLGTYSEIHEEQQPKLPGFTNAVSVTASKRRAEELPATKGRKRSIPEPAGIVLPDGFSRQEVKRDVESSLVALVALQPAPADVLRFIQRNYKRAQQPLSYEMLCAVWMFARLGRLDGLANVSETSSFVRNCVAAWDTLEVARRDAMEALVSLREEHDLVVLHQSATKLMPLWEPEARELMRLLELAGADSAAFDRARAWLNRRIDAGALVVSSVEELNEVQILRIATLVGLDTEVISRVEESRIRQHLAELGMERDSEHLVPIGVTAVRAGFEEEFLAACRLRAEGAEDWDAALAALLAR